MRSRQIKLRNHSYNHVQVRRKANIFPTRSWLKLWIHSLNWCLGIADKSLFENDAKTHLLVLLEAFKDLISDWWQSSVFRWTSSYLVTEKIKALQVKLKAWNRDVSGEVEENKKSTLTKVAFWDDTEVRDLFHQLNLRKDWQLWRIQRGTQGP